jgi:hypothetical protein
MGFELAGRTRMTRSAISPTAQRLGQRQHRPPRGPPLGNRPPFLTDKENRILDFGYCLARLTWALDGYLPDFYL